MVIGPIEITEKKFVKGGIPLKSKNLTNTVR